MSSARKTSGGEPEPQGLEIDTEQVTTVSERDKGHDEVPFQMSKHTIRQNGFPGNSAGKGRHPFPGNSSGDPEDMEGRLREIQDSKDDLIRFSDVKSRGQ